MEFISLLASVGTSFAIFLLLMFAYSWLSRRPGNHVVYYPNRILRGLVPYEAMRCNPFQWIPEAFSSTESDVIRISGVDAAVYFVFLSTVLGIFVLAGILLLPMLLPVAATANTFQPPFGFSNKTSNFSFANVTSDDFDNLSMGNVQERSPRLWAFAVATYWVSFVAYSLLWKAYRHVSELRATSLMSSEPRNEQFAVLVRDIPPVQAGQTRKEQVDSYFRTIYPNTFYGSMVVTDNREVNKIYKELDFYKRKRARAEVVHKASVKGIRPTCRTGWLGLVGERVDEMDYYDRKIKETVPKLEAEQKTTLKHKQQRAALIFFNNMRAAAAAAQSLHSNMVDTWTVTVAPEPRQLIWTNLAINFYERQCRQYVIYFVVFLAIFFYMIPIGFISAMTTLDNLRKLLPFLKGVVDRPALKTVLEAYLPQLSLLLFLALLPRFLLFLSKAEGIATKSHAVRATSGKYFYFSVLNVFLGVTIGSTLFSTLKTIEKKGLNTAVELLAESLPGSANFFLTFVALKFFVGNGLELSRLVSLTIFHFKRIYYCKTEAEVEEAWNPGDAGYATRVPNDLLVATIVICYSVMTPIILPFGAMYFAISWLVLRHQVLKVYVPAYESYGQMWPHIFKRVVAALFLFQLTMLGYFGTKEFYYTPLLIPLPFLSLVFAFFCSKKFYRFFQSPALEVAAREPKEAPDMELVMRSFIPTSLRSDRLVDDYQLENALFGVQQQVRPNDAMPFYL